MRTTSDISTSSAERELQPGRLSSPVLVGREREFALLVRLARHPPAVLVVEGEAGVGKSRLVGAAADEPELAGRRVLIGRCHRLREPFPLGPVIEALREVGGDLSDAVLSGAAGAVRPLLPELSERLPRSPPPLDDPRAERHRVFRGLRELLGALGPAVCVLEDLHWADEDTLEFLSFLVSELPADLSLVLTCRNEGRDSSPALAAVAGRIPQGTSRARVNLCPLSVEDVRRLVCVLAGREDVSETFAACLHRRVGGLPVAVEEVVCLLREKGELDRLAEARWPEQALEQLGVPPNVRHSILERTRLLGKDAQLVLRSAAVLGSPATEDLIMDVAGLPARREGAFDRALSSGLLEKGDGDRYTIRHALASQTIYEATGRAVRRELHWRAGRALESGGGPRILAEVARHLREGGSSRWGSYAEAAAQAARASGDDCLAACVLEEALLTQALSKAARVRMAIALGEASVYSVAPEKAVRLLRRTLDEEAIRSGVRGELRLSLARLLAHAGHSSSARTEAVRAIGELRKRPQLGVRAMVNLAHPLWHREGDLDDHLHWLDRAMETAPADDRVAQIAVLAQRAAILVTIGDPGGWAAAADIPSAGAAVEERLQLLRGKYNIAQAALSLGHPRRAADFLAQADRVGRQLDHEWCKLWLESARISVDWGIGRWAGLEHRVASLSELTATTPGLHVGNQLLLGSLQLARGELEAAERSLHSTFAAARVGDSVAGLAAAAGRLARLCLERGEPQQARELTALGLDAIRAKRIWVWARPVAPEAVDALIACGEPDLAGELADELASGLSDRDAPAAEAALAWCRGAVAESAARYERAGELFGRAEQGWRRLSNPYEAARARERRAYCSLRGRRAGGEALLQEAQRTFESLGATHDANRLKAQLAARGVWRRGRKGYGDELSPREREVVQLAAMGKTNNEIAAALFISPRTVEEHVASAVRKLGVSSKRALATFVLSAE